jgi:pilus assembly protein CpaB
MQRPNIKINKTWAMLIVAIVLSLLTAWLTMQYLKHREVNLEAEIRARSEQGGGTKVDVVVPRKALLPGATVDDSVVAARPISSDFVYDDTITVAQFDSYKGQALLRPVERGRPLRKSDLRELFADFSGTLKPGKRAMTINVDEVNSISHMVEPGNLVDLMLVLSSSDASMPSQTVVPFLDQIKVLATGQKVTQDDPSDPASSEHRRSYSNLTLEVTPTEAARLSLALELGKIRAVLRNEKDKQVVDFDAVNADNMLEDIRERERQRMAARPPRPMPKAVTRTPSGLYVEYIIGGGKGADTVVPSMNVAVPGAIETPQVSSAANVAAQAQATSAKTLSDLIKMSAGTKASTDNPSTK